MKIKNRWFGLLLVTSLLTFLITNAVFASATSSTDKKEWVAQIRPGVMGGNGTTDYFLEFFIPLWNSNKTLIFIDPHLRYNRGDYFESFTQDEMEENIGIGSRFLLQDGKVIFGVNAFYDIMQSKEENNYNQFGFGLELLSRWGDFRANYYHPFSTTCHHMTAYDRYRFGSTGILLYKGREEALEGFDAELGFLIPVISNYMETRLAGGIYWYYPEEMESFAGLKGRLEIRPVNMLNLTYEVKHDDVRGTDQFWGGYLEIPFSLEALAAGKNPFIDIKESLALGRGARSLSGRMTDKIVRDRNIVTIKYTGHNPVTAPGGDNIIYVNADYAGAGFGTYEAPYPDIASIAADARWNPGAIVYVFSYDDEADTYNDHFIMKENTTLWGQGYLHPLWQLGGGVSPVLDGQGAGNVITLADGNEMMGLIIQNGERGIYGENITTSYIHDNTIRNNLGAEDPSGAIHIVNNFTDAELSGSSLSLKMNNNQVIDNGDYGIYLATNIASPSEAGLTDTVITGEFAGNTVRSNGDTGIYQLLDVNTPMISGLSASNIIRENVIGSNGGYGVCLISNLNANNTVVPATGDLVATIDSSPVANMFSGNMISGNNGGGINVTTEIAAIANATADVSGNLYAGVTGSPIINLFEDNIASGNGGNGIYIKTTELAEAFVQNAAVAANVAAEMTDSGIANMFTGNEISSSGASGVGIENNIGTHAEAYAESIVAVVDGTGSASSSVGGNIMATTENSRLDNTLTNNMIAGSAVDGVNLKNDVSAYARAYAYASSVGTAQSSVAVFGNVEADIADSGIFNTLTGNEITANGNDGVYLKSNIFAHAETGANTAAGFGYAGASSSNVAGDIRATTTTSSLLYAFSNNTISGNTDDGADMENDIVSLANAFSGTQTIWNGGSTALSTVGGSVLAVTGSSSLSGDFTDNDIVGNSGDGVYVKNDVGAYAESDATAQALGGENNATVNIDGSLMTTIGGLSLSDNYSSNNITRNTGDGVYLENNINAYAETYSYAYAQAFWFLFWVYPAQSDVSSTVNGNIRSVVGSLSLNSSFMNNVINGNGGDGLDRKDDVVVYADTYASAYAATSYDTASASSTAGGDITETDNSAVSISMRNNQVTGNTQNGVNLNAGAGGTYTADLGTESSAGSNSLYNNGDGITYYDVVNNTGTAINTVSNWWGADADPAGQISNVSGTTDYDPWLNAAP